MKKRRPNFLIYQFLCFLMALHVINLSIDVRGDLSLRGREGSYQKDLSVNEIESISELLLESCFGIPNAVPERDDQDSDENTNLESLEDDYVFTQFFRFHPLPSPVQYLITSNVPFRPAHVSKHVLEIIAPPPQPVT